MIGIPDTLGALAELERTLAERQTTIARGNAGPGAVDRFLQLKRAVQIVFLASQITYHESSDPTLDEMRKYGIAPP
jgi:hypothetical protein